jgi:hypothetical protein
MDLTPEQTAVRCSLRTQEHLHLSGAELATMRHLLSFERTLHLDACVSCETRHTRRHGPAKYPRLTATEAG